MTIPAALPVKPEHKELYYVTVAEHLPKFQNNIKDKLFARLD
jgi:hypothetical protein